MVCVAGKGREISEKEHLASIEKCYLCPPKDFFTRNVSECIIF